MPKILIADDEANILMLTSILFRDIGFEVIGAVDGEEAIEKAISEHPDIIVTDLIMPKKGGHDVCRHIRNVPELAHIPIIILSAMGDEYSKITGFEEGADDYITKPFNIDELKARVNALLMRSEGRNSSSTRPTPDLPAPSDQKNSLLAPVSTGLSKLDECLFGGVPKGSNILLTGPLGLGKSSFARSFIVGGLQASEAGLFVAIDDNPSHIRNEMDQKLDKTTAHHENIRNLRFVDGYSWCSPNGSSSEQFAVTGSLELNALSSVISDAGATVGQTVQEKRGGRRVIDSISSLCLHFSLAEVQRFVNQISRTALAFGGVTTLFILEEGTVTPQVLNNIKYIMDGIIQFGRINDKQHVRVSSMKWSKYKPDWIPLEG